jgi:hypothetical protein
MDALKRLPDRFRFDNVLKDPKSLMAALIAQTDLKQLYDWLERNPGREFFGLGRATLSIHANASRGTFPSLAFVRH